MLRFMFITILLSFGSFGCGDRPERTIKDKETVAIVGSWQHIFDQEGFNACDPNTDCKCADVFNFYTGNTFERNLKCDYSKGYFAFKGDQIQLNYVSAYPQIFQYELDTNELQLVKENTIHKYVRKPFKTMSIQ